MFFEIMNYYSFQNQHINAIFYFVSINELPVVAFFCYAFFFVASGR